MNQVIITGATGFIGSRLVRMLLEDDFEVLAIGRKEWNDIDRLKLSAHKNLTYVCLDMKDIRLLPNELNRIAWNVKNDCVFYHFAWGGLQALSDLDVSGQVANISWTTDAIVSAEAVGCTKFVHVGTMEEAFADAYLKLDHKCNDEFNRHVVYSIAKKYAREMLKSLSSNYKIDLMFGTNSHVMGPNDDKDSFLQKTLLKLIGNEKLEFTSGAQVFDVISVTDCARAYKCIGLNGKRNSEYWVGSGEPRTLKQYVEIMANLYPSSQALEFGKVVYNDVMLKYEDFSTRLLEEDTSFSCSKSYEETVKELHNWLEYRDLNE